MLPKALLLAALPIEILAALTPTPLPYQTGFFDAERPTWVQDGRMQDDAGRMAQRARSLHLPIYQRSKRALSKRSSHEVKSWARREKARIRSKYLQQQASPEQGSSLQPLKRGTIDRRQDNGYNQEWNTWTTGPDPSPTVDWRLGDVSMTNYLVDLEYFAPIQIGSPPQTYNVILDTGSADFWLASNECDVSQCGSVPRYNVTASNSSVDLNSSFTIRYGQGTASGELYNDTVILAGRNLTQGFAACSAVSQDLLSGNVSGIMGLGFELLAQSKITPFWQNYFQTLASQNLTSQYAFPGFAFSLSRFINVTDAEDLEPGGVFSLGTLNNASFTGPINWIDLPDPEEASYWYIPMDAVMFNSTPVPGINTNETRVAMDTGTTLIGGPSDVVAAIYSNIPGAQQASGDYEGYWTYPCSAQFSLGFVFNNITYNITDADFNLGTFETATVSSPAQCLGVFFDLDLSANSAAIISWVIGAAFLKNVYSIYRFAPNISIGFAELNPYAMASYYPPVTATTTSTLPYVHSGAPFGPPGILTTMVNGTPTVLAVQETLSVTSDASQLSTMMHKIFQFGALLLTSVVLIH